MEKKMYFTNGYKSDFNYNHILSTFGTNLNVHNSLMQKLDDEQLEGSGFVLNGIVNIIMEVYKVNDIQVLRGLSCQKIIKIINQL